MNGDLRRHRFKENEYNHSETPMISHEPPPPRPSPPPQKGDHIGYTLGIRFFRAAVGAERHLLGGDKATSSNRETNAGTDEDEDVGVTSGGGTWPNAGVDCELLVAGSYLHAHKVVLASRSPVLRDMIAQVRQDKGRESARNARMHIFHRPIFPK